MSSNVMPDTADPFLRGGFHRAQIALLDPDGKREPTGRDDRITVSISWLAGILASVCPKCYGRDGSHHVQCPDF